MLRSIAAVAVLGALSFVCEPASAEVIDRIVAKINDDIITLNDLKRASGPYLLAFGIEPKELPKREDAGAIYKQVLDDMINTRLLVQEAKTFKLEVSEDDVSEWIENIRTQQSLSEASFRSALSAKGIRWHDYRRYVRDNLLKFRVVQVKVGSRVKITDEEVAKAYQGEFKTLPAAGVTTVDVSHIFVPKPEGDPAAQAKARALIDSVAKRLDGGEDFAAVAAEVSAGPTASDGGRLGKYRPGELDKEIDDVVFAMKAGETSAPIEVESGFHIFKVHEIIVERDPKVEERMRTLRAKLRDELLNKQLEAWLETLRQRAYVRVMF